MDICTAKSKLKDAIIPEQVERVIRVLRAMGHQAFLVGGCVRDILLDRCPKDYDVTTSATPDVVQNLFSRTIPTGIEHGTVTVMQGDFPVEVTTFRSDGDYSDGRRPDSVQFETDITKDLSRRDFTINAIAYDPVYETIADPFGGIADLPPRDGLYTGIIRAVGNPADRFAEDGLRIIRAIRFMTTLHTFKMDQPTWDAIGPAIPIFAKVSRERVTEEFKKILAGNDMGGIWALFQSGLLASFLPEVATEEDINMMLIGYAHRMHGLPYQLAVLFYRKEALIEQALTNRLKLPAKVVKKATLLAQSIKPLSAMPQWSDAAIRQFAAQWGEENMDEILTLQEAVHRYAVTHARLVLGRKPPLTVRELALPSADVMVTLNCPPGRQVGDAQRAMLSYVLEHPEKNTREDLIAFLRRGVDK